MQPIRSLVVGLENWLWRFEAAAVVLLFLSVVAISFLQVLCRYVFSYPLPWTEELAVGLFIWVAFIGSTMAVAARGHFAIEFVKNRLPAAARMLADFLIWSLSLLFLLVVAIWGIFFVLGPAPSMTTLPVSMRWFYSAVPVGAILMLLHLVLHEAKVMLEHFGARDEIKPG
jgi:TRAP-type C4-dicarboxylate transport system permease small subunit